MKVRKRRCPNCGKLTNDDTCGNCGFDFGYNY